MKYALASLATLPFLVASAWLVHGQGVAYRRSSRDSRAAQLLARAVAEPGRPIAPVGDEPSPDEAGDSLDPAAGKPALIAGATDPVPPVEPAPAPPILDRVADPAPLVEAPPALAALEAEPAARFPKLTTDIDKDALSLGPEEERSIGRTLHEAIVQRHRIVDSGPMQRRLFDAARPLLAGRQRKQIDYTFTILDSDNVYAFSHPGGYLYATRGIFSLIADDQELQFLLGHEIAHVDLKHDAALVSAAALVDNAAGRLDVDLAQRFYHQIAKGHDDEQEYEADAWAFRRMIQADQTAYQARRFLRKYLDYVERNGGGAGRQPPRSPLDAELQDVENHWRSHPPALERLERLKAMKGGP